jgi:hypothetical protein
MDLVDPLGGVLKGLNQWLQDPLHLTIAVAVFILPLVILYKMSARPYQRGEQIGNDIWRPDLDQ